MCRSFQLPIMATAWVRVSECFIRHNVFPGQVWANFADRQPEPRGPLYLDLDPIHLRPGPVQVRTRFEPKKMKYIEVCKCSFDTQPPIHISSSEVLKPTAMHVVNCLEVGHNTRMRKVLAHTIGSDYRILPKSIASNVGKQPFTVTQHDHRLWVFTSTPKIPPWWISRGRAMTMHTI